MTVVAPIGGQLISSYGGALGFRPFQGVLPIVNTPPTTAGQALLDVARWELFRKSAVDDTTHTGSWGAQGVDVTCIGFNAVAEVIWDLYNPPNYLAQFGGLVTGALTGNLGAQLWLYVGGGTIDGSNSLGPYYYFAPSVKANVVQSQIDAEGKKMVRARIDLIGNSPIFAFGGQLNDLAQYNAYIVHCMTRNWVW